MIYFRATAHGTHVPGNKTPLMCALLSHRGRKSRTCIHNGGGGGNYFEITFFFSFGLCDSFACWWKIDVNHSPWLLSNIHSLYTHYSSVLIYSHSILILTLLLCSLFSSPYFTQFHFIQMSPFSLTTLTTKTKIYLHHCTACKLYFY